MAWELRVTRRELSTATVIETPTPRPRPGQVLLRSERVGMTANNVTYAVFGDAMRYWDFFPTADVDDEPQGLVPLWGFAVVEDSTVDDLEPGTKVFGYLPTASHLLVEPCDLTESGFRDASPHRSELPAAYNSLSIADRATSTPELDDLQILYRPLFMTSFLLADFLSSNDHFGADAVVFSSASSKTAYGTAFLLTDIHRIGLTSEANRDFTESLGCYDEVRSYDEVARLTRRPAVYVDIAGDAGLRRRVHERFEPVHSAVVGASHHDAEPDHPGSTVPGAAPEFFFAPDQLQARQREWGPGGVEERHRAAWDRFTRVVGDWVDVTVARGPEGLRSSWLEALAGSASPRLGRVVAL